MHYKIYRFFLKSLKYQYLYSFKNFHIIVIQYVYRKYKKSELLAIQIWNVIRIEVFRYYFINEKLISDNCKFDIFYIQSQHNLYNITI